MKRLFKLLGVGLAMTFGVAATLRSDQGSEVCPCDDIWELAIAWTNCYVRADLRAGLFDHYLMVHDYPATELQWLTTDSEFTNDPICLGALARPPQGNYPYYCVVRKYAYDVENDSCADIGVTLAREDFNSTDEFGACKKSLLYYYEQVENLPPCP